MLTKARETLKGPAGTAIAIVVLLIGLVLAYFMLFGRTGESDAADAAQTRIYIDSTTGTSFSHTVKIGDFIPVPAPSGGNTGYPAELCYWTADGKIKSTATPVLVNLYVGKPGPTFCPDCGRLVVPHNAKPAAGDKAPPLKADYKPTKPAARE